MVQELADLGVSQVRGLHAPSEFNDWQELKSPELDFEGDDLTDLAKHSSYKDFYDVAKSIIKLAGEGCVNPNVRVSIRPSDPLERERDSAAIVRQHHNDRIAIRDGFTMLCAIRPKNSEHLHTAGRGSQANVNEFQKRFYRRGTVLLAQNAFGKSIVPPESETNATWHVGYRKRAGGLIIIDLSFDGWGS